MIGAQVLSLVRRRVLMWAVALLPVVLVIVIFVVRLLLHSSSPGEYEQAGGVAGFDAAMSGVDGLGSLLAVVLGATAGSSDAASGVIRDLVSTGRSRVRLVLERLPAPLLVAMASSLIGGLAALVGSALVSGADPLGSGSHLARVIAASLGATGVMAIVACGVASVLGSRGIAIGVILGWLFLGETALLFALRALSKGAEGVLLGPAITAVQEALAGSERSQSDIALGVAGIAIAAWIALAVGLGVARTVRKEW